MKNKKEMEVYLSSVHIQEFDLVELVTVNNEHESVCAD